MAVIGELGRYPLFIEVIVNMFSYLSRLTSTEDKLLSEALLVSKSLSNHSKKSWFNSMSSLAKYLDINLLQDFRQWIEFVIFFKKEVEDELHFLLKCSSLERVSNIVKSYKSSKQLNYNLNISRKQLLESK